MLTSLSDTIPIVLVSEGRVRIHQLMRFWGERRLIAAGAAGLSPDSEAFQAVVDRLNYQREDQEAILRSFEVSALTIGCHCPASSYQDDPTGLDRPRHRSSTLSRL